MNKDKRIKTSLMVILSVLCVLSLIPIIYCSFFDYATGDDLAKSANVHRLIVHGASFFEIIAQAARDAKDIWYWHEGTWASNFVLALQPSIWGEKCYIVTPFIGLAFLFVGVGVFLHDIVVKVLDYSKLFFWIIFFPIIILMSQYMPFIRGGLFWFTGMAHYTIPLGVTLILLVLNRRFLSGGSFKLLPIMIFLSIYMGGSHYQAIILALIIQLFYTVVYFKKENLKYTVAMGMQILIELVGLIICAKAPGNAERAGDEFGFGAGRAVYTVLHSIVVSTQDGIEYITTRKLIPVVVLFVVALTLCVQKKREKNIIPKYAFLVVFSYLIYCAMYAPGVYYSTFDADEGISGGFYDFNYFCFLIFIAVTAVLIGEILVYLVKGKVAKKCAVCLVGIGFVFLVAFSKSILKNSADYMIYDYVKGGHLKDFVSQMEERLEILNDESQREVVLPEMNSEQGPFMHMALTSDINNFTNVSTMSFYDKDSVIAIPRDEYYKEYGE